MLKINSTRARVALILLVAIIVTVSCNGSGQVKDESSGETKTVRKLQVNGKDLTAKMSDEQIIRAFNIDPQAARSETVQGKDGTMVTFTAGVQVVIITRSTVSGTIVKATGPISGSWELSQ